MKSIALRKHLLARRFWWPLRRCWSRLTLPLWNVPFPLVPYVPRGAKPETQPIYVPLGMLLSFRVQRWLAQQASMQRNIHLFHPSSLAYDIAAFGAALLAPLARQHRRFCERMIRETDPRLRQDSSRN